MKLIKAMGVALLLASTLLFSACNKEDIKKEFSQENLTLTSWTGTVEMDYPKVYTELSIRFDADNQCLLRWIEKYESCSSSCKYQIEGGKRITFTDLHHAIPFSAGPWTVMEFSDNKLVLKHAIESPHEKERQTITLKRVE